MPKITGPAAQALVEREIKAHSDGVIGALARFDGRRAFYTWLDTVRALEEFINLPLFGLNDAEALAEAIRLLRLDALDPGALAPIRVALAAKFGKAFAERFGATVLQASAIGAAFRMHGMFEAAAGLATVEHAVGYFQSRRRHLAAILYALPAVGQGKERLERLDTINQFLPLVEHSSVTLTGLYQNLMLARVFPDFSLDVGAHGFIANHHYEPLDRTFIEPERAGILEMRDRIAGGAPALEPVDPRLLFSPAEMRNNIRLIEAAYAEFDLASTTFGPVAAFVRSSLAGCRDGYSVKLGARDFDRLASQAGLSTTMREQLVHRGGDLVACTNAIAPFIVVGETLVSTVTFLGRYLYYWKSACLNRSRRFQIRSGFIFENSVKAALAKQGFAVTSVKRIDRKEFDVVATLGGVIYNLQCKNNLVDLARIESDPARFARYNRQLDRSYARALAKEEAREVLLKHRLGIDEVRHLVISRFPVATTNPRVIAFSRIGELRQRLGV